MNAADGKPLQIAVDAERDKTLLGSLIQWLSQQLTAPEQRQKWRDAGVSDVFIEFIDRLAAETTSAEFTELYRLLGLTASGGLLKHSNPAPFLSIQVNVPDHQHQLPRPEYLAALAYCLTFEASNEMLRELFRLSREDITRLKSKCQAVGGRTPLPDIEVRHDVWEQWLHLTKAVPDIRLRYCALHRQFQAQYSLRTLYAIVNQSLLESAALPGKQGVR